MAEEKQKKMADKRVEIEDFYDKLTEHEKALFMKEWFLRQRDAEERKLEIEYAETKKRWTVVITQGIMTAGTGLTIVFGSKFAKPLLKMVLH